MTSPKRGPRSRAPSPQLVAWFVEMVPLHGALDQYASSRAEIGREPGRRAEVVDDRDARQIEAALQRGLAEMNERRRDAALRWYRRAEALCRASGTPARLAEILEYIAAVRISREPLSAKAELLAAKAAWDSCPARTRKPLYHAALGWLLLREGRWRSSGATFRAGCEILSGAAGFGLMAQTCRLGLAVSQLALGDDERVLDTLRRSEHSARPEHDPAQWCAASCARAQALIGLGRPHEARAVRASILRCARTDPSVRLELLQTLACEAVVEGSRRRANSLIREGLASALAAANEGGPRSALDFMVAVAAAAQGAGRAGEARRWLSLAESVLPGALRFELLGARASLAAAASDDDEVVRIGCRVAELPVPEAARFDAARILGLAGNAELARRRATAAQRFFERCRENFAALGYPNGVGDAWQGLAAAAHLEGNATRERACLEQALAVVAERDPRRTALARRLRARRRPSGG